LRVIFDSILFNRHITDDNTENQGISHSRRVQSVYSTCNDDRTRNVFKFSSQTIINNTVSGNLYIILFGKDVHVVDVTGTSGVWSILFTA